LRRRPGRETIKSRTFSEALISIAIEPKTKADEEKLAQGLARLMAEDPAFRASSLPEPDDDGWGADSSD
jgi:translation elongation factor EF-G